MNHLTHTQWTQNDLRTLNRKFNNGITLTELSIYFCRSLPDIVRQLDRIGKFDHVEPQKNRLGKVLLDHLEVEHLVQERLKQQYQLELEYAQWMNSQEIEHEPF
jgi:hypothetical protein